METLAVIGILNMGLLAAGTIAMIYVICLIVGGGLLVISTFLGGDADVGTDVDFDLDADFDVDVDGDLSADHGDHSGALDASSWFSTQFLIYFAAAFGGIGTVLTFVSEVSSTPALVCSIIGGVIIGQAAHWGMQAIKRSSGSGHSGAKDFLNCKGRVTHAIQPPNRGEVALLVRGVERFLPAAASRNDDKFDVGSSVVVVSYEQGVARVISTKEHEFLTDGKSS